MSLSLCVSRGIFLTSSHIRCFSALICRKSNTSHRKCLVPYPILLTANVSSLIFLTGNASRQIFLGQLSINILSRLIFLTNIRITLKFLSPNIPHRQRDSGNATEAYHLFTPNHRYQTSAVLPHRINWATGLKSNTAKKKT